MGYVAVVAVAFFSDSYPHFFDKGLGAIPRASPKTSMASCKPAGLQQLPRMKGWAYCSTETEDDGHHAGSTQTAASAYASAAAAAAAAQVPA